MNIPQSANEQVVAIMVNACSLAENLGDALDDVEKYRERCDKLEEKTTEYFEQILAEVVALEAETTHNEPTIEAFKRIKEICERFI